jgi:RNA polymerase sigma-70 factor (ECF subfamily)
MLVQIAVMRRFGPQVDAVTEERDTVEHSPVRVLGWRGDDAELLRRLRNNPSGGATLLHDRFATLVNRLVWRLLGADAEHDDLVQQIFCRLLARIHQVRDAERLGAWVQSVTVSTVYSELRKRQVRRWFSAEASAERFEDVVDTLEARDLLARTYQALDRLGARDRVVFILKHVEERPMHEVAQLCGCSVATAKRRLDRAERRFAALVRHDPELAERLARGRGM